MKRKLVFATNNLNKLKEVRNVEGLNCRSYASSPGFSNPGIRNMPDQRSAFEILSLKDIGFSGEIPEDFDTLKENALQKARVIHSFSGLDCFADDTGLEIDALDGKPGVLSARYAGPACNSEDNIDKVLEELKGKTIRTARFRTVIALIMDGEEHFFESTVEGEILAERQGEDGFGYDPIFLPSCYTQSFAEMDLSFKNKISHRAKAVRKLIKYLVNK